MPSIAAAPLRQPPASPPWWALWAASVVAAIFAVLLLTHQTMRDHLRGDAQASAEQFAVLLTTSATGLPEFLRESRPDPQVLEQLRRMRQAGHVFRFKLFDADGVQRLVSDELDRPDLGSDGGQPGQPRKLRNEVARGVAIAGQGHVELWDGAKKPDRPDVYSEAYVPLVQGGRVVGVLEAYVDQTEHRAHIYESFAKIALIVAAVLAALGTLGALQWRQRLRAERKIEERVRYLARHDVLSGALNRASFHDELREAVARHRETGQGFAVLCLDLDRFKEVNDAMGHAAGDEVLRGATARLRQLVRHGDALARLGGDEFAILQCDVSGPEGVTLFAQRIVGRLAEPYTVAGQAVQCGGSVGAAIFGVDTDDVADLLHKADLALYRAKADGRGTFSFYDPELDRQLGERRALTHDLRDAVAREALSVDYQPLFAADGRTLLGYEALLRWRHPTRGPVSPAEFIPLAEDCGLIEALGAWVLRRACRDAAGWGRGLSVSVNLSPAQFRTDQLPQVVAAALQEGGLPAQRLELEITESLLMSNTDHVLRTLHALRDMGVRIAMDDFGTGYSSLAYLWQFPFDKVKIDRAFTKNLHEDAKVSLIVRSIVSLAHSLQIRVNAEGVETAAQMETLRSHGCDELQGFLLGRPAPLSALPDRRRAAGPEEARGPAPGAESAPHLERAGP